MSVIPYPEYPDDLKLSTWDKKSGSMPTDRKAPGFGMPDTLKALKKKHDAIDWTLFERDWADEAKTVDELQQEFAKRDRLYRSSVFALKRDALAVASAAKSMEKGAARPVLEAAKAIAKAANGYADAVDSGIDELKPIYDKALAGLAKAKPKGKDDEEDDEDAAASALLDPLILFKQLKMCRNDPELTMQFAFVDANKAMERPAAMAMHKRMSGKKLFKKLQDANEMKTGAFGSVWIDGTSLMLQLDKPTGGLVKKVRGPVKACGFKISKAVLWNEDGTVFEESTEKDDEAGEQSEAGAVAAGGASAAGAASAAPPGPSANRPAPPGGPAAKTVAEPKAVSPEVAAFKERLKALLLLAAAAGDLPAAKDAKLLGSQAGVASTKGDWAQVDALMKQAEALLSGVKVNPAAAGAAAPTVTTPKPAAGVNAPMAQGTTQAPPMNTALAFKARLTGLVPRVKALESADAAAAAQVNAKREEAVALARLKGVTQEQMSQAMTLLDEIEALLARSSDSGSSFDEAAFRAAWRTAREGWKEAIETVDGQIAKLQAALRNEADEDLAAIAEFGLPALTGDFKAPMMAAVMDVDRAGSDGLPRAARRARSLAASFAEYLDEAETVAVTDDNDFGVTVTIRKTIGGALRQVEQTLSQAAG